MHLQLILWQCKKYATRIHKTCLKWQVLLYNEEWITINYILAHPDGAINTGHITHQLRLSHTEEALERFFGKMNKLLSASVSMNLLYDDDVKLEIDNDGDGNIDRRGPRVQFKELFAVDYVLKF
jgi:hypothetical protein